MKAVFCLMTIIAVLFFSGPAKGGEDNQQSLTEYYQAAINQEIQSCLSKQSLQDSRSIELQRKGHLEASKAQFLIANRNLLVVAMVQNNVGRKPYKVQHFLNDQFHCTCYAQWQAKASF